MTTYMSRILNISCIMFYIHNNTVLPRLNIRVGIYSHVESIISLSEILGPIKLVQTPLLFIEVPIPSQEVNGDVFLY